MNNQEQDKQEQNKDKAPKKAPGADPQEPTGNKHPEYKLPGTEEPVEEKSAEIGGKKTAENEEDKEPEKTDEGVPKMKG